MRHKGGEMIKKSLALIVIGSISAFALTVHPIPVQIDKDKRYAEFKIGDDSGKYQVFIKRWSQNEKGEDVLEDTKDIVVYPKLFQAPKVLRIYAKRKDPKTEQSYRLILKELNIEKESKGKTVVLKTLSIPLFVLPQKKKPKLRTECTKNVLKIVNEGNVHFKILSIGKKSEVIYVLPNQKKEVRNVEVRGEIETNRGKFQYECR